MKLQSIMCALLSRNPRISAFKLTSEFSLRSCSSLRNSAEDLVARQKAVSNTANQPFATEGEHLAHQQASFNQMASYFANREEMIPPELLPVYQALAISIASTVKQSPKDEYTIIDGACGTGILYPFLKQAFRDNVTITGVDLSPNMVEEAHKQLPEGCKDSYVVSNLIDYEPEEQVDAVILNACFGNFWNQTAILEQAASWTDGHVFVTHPLGASFVQRLHHEDKPTVPHTLPLEWGPLLRFLPLQLADLQTDIDVDGVRNDFYCATLRKVRHRCLSQMMRFRGKVASGFGRGGKKLGFPTANLDPPVFREALKDVDTGVYFGWAVLEESKVTSAPLKAVVNVGISPTFAGEENAEKIIEAHIITEDETQLGDFYNQTMKLQLFGYLRDEVKFPSFPDLIAQITADRDEAQLALGLDEYALFREDPFLVDPTSDWRGQAGGDKDGSWDLVDTGEFTGV